MALMAAIHYPRGFDIDRLLVDVCAEIVSSGLRIGGLLQLSTGERGGSCATTVNVVDLRTNQAFDIWQDRGPCARGCRLDEGGLADAEAVLQAAIDERVDLLIVNRFGRAESLGRGLRGAFAEAIEATIPLLTAVRAPYDVGWSDFHGGIAEHLDCKTADVISWALSLPRSNLADRHEGAHHEVP